MVWVACDAPAPPVEECLTHIDDAMHERLRELLREYVDESAIDEEEAQEDALAQPAEVLMAAHDEEQSKDAEIGECGNDGDGVDEILMECGLEDISKELKSTKSEPWQPGMFQVLMCEGNFQAAKTATSGWRRIHFTPGDIKQSVPSNCPPGTTLHQRDQSQGVERYVYGI